MRVRSPSASLSRRSRSTREATVEALARGIIKELRAAGLEIRRTDAIPIRNPRC
jgi:hypothetical protein